MNSQKVESELTKMHGKTWMYKGKNHRILRFAAAAGTITITTDLKDIILDTDKFDPADWLPAEDEEKGVAVVTARQTVIQSSAVELKNILMDNIRKVQENKDYIPQAQEVNSNVKSIIDLAKAEIDLMKAMR